MKDSHLPVRVYLSPEDLADHVLKDLTRAIEMDFPRLIDPDHLAVRFPAKVTWKEINVWNRFLLKFFVEWLYQLEQLAHQQFIENRTRCFVPEERLLAKLNDFAEKAHISFYFSGRQHIDRNQDTNSLLVLSGEAGSGKSSLLAAWVKRCHALCSSSGPLLSGSG